MKQLDPLQVRNIAEELDIDTPIMAHKIVGSRVELHLLGGAVAFYDLPAAEKPLGDMDYDELYALAQKLKLRGRSNMSTEALRVAIKKKLEAS